MKNPFRKKEQVIEPDVTPSLEERLKQQLDMIDAKTEGSVDTFKSFLDDLRNSEIIDIADIHYDDSKVSLWDYAGPYVDMYEKEIARRCIPKDEETIELLNQWHPNWVGKDSKLTKFNALIEQVDGIQTKVDNIMKVLSKFEVCLSAEEAVNLAKQ